MSCAHPVACQVFDRIRGTMTCGFCGEVVSDQQYELDPAFNRGDKPAGGRPPPGFARPMRSTLLANPGTNRPSIENARRSMQAISRQLEISQDDVEKAVAIFKLAVNNNAIAGSRPSALCACLYAVCRRANTPHTIFDFADATKETPYSILGYLKTICRATATQLPSPDPTFYVHRLAQLLNLGDQTEEITILAVKILRAMNAEWLGYGRRPLGLCGAAVLVAANAFGVQRNVNDVVNFVRLSPDTIFLRMSEFLKTDAASLIDIDDYKPSNTALPPALLRKPAHDWVQESSDRHLAQLYYSLLNEAKQSAPVTEERANRWREFIQLHCKTNNLEVVDDVLDLSTLSPYDQLAILGVKDVTPATAESVTNLQEIESTRLIVSAAVAALGSEAPPAAAATPSNSQSMAGHHHHALGGMDDYGSMTVNHHPSASPANAGGASSSSMSGPAFNMSGFDSTWGGMGGVAEDHTQSLNNNSTSLYGGEEVDEFSFGGGSSNNMIGGGGNDFGFGDFDGMNSNNNNGVDSFNDNGYGGGGNNHNNGYGGGGGGGMKMDPSVAKAEGIKKELMTSQVNSVQSMLQRFEQLRQLNNDVTTHVANVVQKARFDIIVLPPVHTDLGLAPPPPPQTVSAAAVSSNNNGVGDSATEDPFATATYNNDDFGATTVKVKEEPMNSQLMMMDHQQQQDVSVGAAAEDDAHLMAAPTSKNAVVKISDLLSSDKNIKAVDDAPIAALAPPPTAATAAEDDQKERKRTPTTQSSPTTVGASSQQFYGTSVGVGAAPPAQLAPDLQMYIIQDLEVRLRLEAAGKRVFGEKWDAGAAKGDDEVLQAEIRACIAHGDDTVDVGADGKVIGEEDGGSGANAPAARRRMKIRKHATAAQAIKESLRNKGASQIDVSGIFGDEDEITGNPDAANTGNGDSDGDEPAAGWDE